MGMFDKDFDSAIKSTDAVYIRGKMGVDKGNKFIQDTYNKVRGTNYCGYNKK